MSDDFKIRNSLSDKNALAYYISVKNIYGRGLREEQLSDDFKRRDSPSAKNALAYYITVKNIHGRGPREE